MTVNDGKGIFDKYGMIDEIKKKLEILSDAKGILRCCLISDVYGMLSVLTKGLKEEEKTNDAIKE